MNVDYSYVDVIFKIIDDKSNIDELKNNVGYQTIMLHSHNTGNDFSLRKIENAVKDISDNAYGLKNLLKNIERIKILYEVLKNKENEWLEEVKMYVSRLFNDIDYNIITIYPVIGYDIGIGLDKKVCVNLNSEICLNDYRELISIIIHETTHICYDFIHGSTIDSLEIETVGDMKNILEKLIQYEGVGVFSAEEYRVKHNLPNSGSRIQEDYEVLTNKDKRLELLGEYRELSDDLLSGRLRDEKEFMERGFGQTKLVHRLGYSIFTQINEDKGIDGVREAINMSNKDFVEKFLR